MIDPTKQAEKNHHWGLWATIGFSCLIFFIFSMLQSASLVAYSMYLGNWDPSIGGENLIRALLANENAISIAEIPAAIIGILLIFFLISFCKPLTAKEYLHLYNPSLKELFKWLGIMILVIISMEAVNIALEREPPDFMSQVNQNTTNFPLLLLAVAIAAPFFEEFLFRGFLFEGLRHSAVGSIGAILITSSVWAVIHVQYGWFEITTIFIIGIIFALAKLKTNSIYIPITMHFLMNFTASIFMVFQQELT